MLFFNTTNIDIPWNQLILSTITIDRDWICGQIRIKYVVEVARVEQSVIFLAMIIIAQIRFESNFEED